MTRQERFEEVRAHLYPLPRIEGLYSHAGTAAGTPDIIDDLGNGLQRIGWIFRP